MHPFEIDETLKTLTVLVDTREQPTMRYRKRLKAMGVPFERRKLDFGDYSAKVILPTNDEISLQEAVCIERKMNIDELCNCYCQGRKRFTKEFDRAKEKGAKIYLLIESGSWESIYSGRYRSLMKPNALTASVLAWLARYNCQIIFCHPDSTGRLIKDILYREMKERLEKQL